MLALPLLSASLPLGFAEVQLATGLDPSAMEFAPDGRLFVLEKPGRVRIVKNDTLLPTPFLTLATDNYNERGLSGIAFDPGFATNGFVYLYYTVLNGVPGASTHNRVIRVTADPSNPDRVLNGSQITLLDLDAIASDQAIHMGGGMFFREGKLYIGTGEAGVGSRSQSLTSLMGKILRINPDGSIPSDNPYYSATTGNFRAIYALGLRNPFSFDVQPGSGLVYINDVGGHSGSYEEINPLIAGANYGWPDRAGFSPVGQTIYQNPVHAYPPGGHNSGYAICGGVFYNPATTGPGRFPDLYTGLYFFGDYVNRWIRTFNPATSEVTQFSTDHHRPLAFRINATGAFYMLTRGNENNGSVDNNTTSNVGIIWKIVHTASNLPSISANPMSTLVSVGAPASFSVSYSGSAPYQIRWQRNGVDLPGEPWVTSSTTATYTLPSAQLTDHGAKFRCVITNSGGSITSQEATLTVTSRQPPNVEIISPSADRAYSGGETITFSGLATDPQDGLLPASALTWRVDFHHDTHTHPALPPVTGVGQGSFLVSNLDHGVNVWYRISLTATNSAGLSRTIHREIFPKFVNITLASQPPGMRVKLDTQEHITPYTYQGIAGMLRSLEAIDPQGAQGMIHSFDSWSHGAAASHTFVTPSTDTTLTAWFHREEGGGITRDYWLNVPGSRVGQLESLSQFPSSPSGGSILGGFEAPSDWSDHYGARLQGRVKPPVTGSYVFHLVSVGEAELWLGSTDQPSSRVRIARSTWDKPSAYDGFDYSTGGIAGQGVGGDGWNNGWAGSGAVVSGSLAYVDSQGASLPLDGGRVSLNQQMAFRNLTENVATGTRWISFVAKAPNPGSGYAGVSLMDSDSERLFLGQRWQSRYWGIERSGGGNVDSSIASDSLAFLVYRMDLGAGVGGSTNVYLWVNPRVGAAGLPLIANRSAQLLNVSAFQFNRLRIAAGATNGGFEVDELRLGTSYAQVAPSSAVGMTADSSPVNLRQGKSYYLEALHKAGSGHDHLSVRWTGPGVAGAVVGGSAVAPLFTPPPLTTFLGWRQTHFRGALADESRSGFSADYNGDGVPNGVAYALGIDPGASGSGALPALTREDGFLKFSYRKDLALQGISYEVESSADLVTWTHEGIVEQEIAAEGTVRRIEARLPAASGPHRFMRLQVRQLTAP